MGAEGIGEERMKGVRGCYTYMMYVDRTSSPCDVTVCLSLSSGMLSQGR